MKQSLKWHSAKDQMKLARVQAGAECIHLVVSPLDLSPQSEQQAPPAQPHSPVLSLRPWGHAGQPHFLCHVKRQCWSEASELRVRVGSALLLSSCSLFFSGLPLIMFLKAG